MDIPSMQREPTTSLPTWCIRELTILPSTPKTQYLTYLKMQLFLTSTCSECGEVANMNQI